MGRSAAFLAAHPTLLDARARSSVWPRILEDATIAVGGHTLFLVAGDTLGDEDDLYLDRLARGAATAGTDPLSRALFLELAPSQRVIVEHELLKPGELP